MDTKNVSDEPVIINEIQDPAIICAKVGFSFGRPPVQHIASNSDSWRDSVIVVLLGWYACHPKVLAKYSDWYNEQGFKTVSVIAPRHYTLWPGVALNRILAKRVLQTLKAVGVGDNGGVSVVIHSFSNGGCFVLEQMIEYVQPSQLFGSLKSSIIGLIFDSCPVALTMESAYAAMTAASNGVIVKAGAAILTGFYGLYYVAFDMAEFYFSKMASKPLSAPELYLYSTSDVVADSSFIDRIIEGRRKGGISVDAVRWDDSPHVAHFKRHFKEYTQEVLSFLQSASALSHEKIVV
eukprot:CAMPEP_0184658928 /NCGR_PEP_ID=MMETSP0308-20130426/27368_1 /TAXON_ID=38269 /ORGANISM="Gloeochaete witrockiana, Strain SAG 46.84" /LENGTH=292 /DNA_ID=CAMNT_0027098295 /DNA_START=171 /DNA_END=1049 /DNA_ORIENTATION=+